MLTHLAGPFAVGVDAGGTTTRCALVTLDGSIAGYGTGPGANLNSGSDPVKALTVALTAALSDIDPALVVGSVVGMAGAGSAGRPRAQAAARAAWRNCGVPGEPYVVTDIAIAFTSGTDEPEGIVVMAGTGAGAAVISEGEIKRRADGYGWLVGDEGSGVWMGREAVRAALASYDGRGAPTKLSETIPPVLLGGGAAEHLMTGLQLPVSPKSELPQAIIKAVYGSPPAALGRLAPLVSEAAMAGDPVAVRITEEAAGHLLLDVDAVRPALRNIRRPQVVTAGSVLRDGPVADAVRAGLLRRFHAPPVQAGDGTMGAARLALRRLNLPRR